MRLFILLLTPTLVLRSLAADGLLSGSVVGPSAKPIIGALATSEGVSAVCDAYGMWKLSLPAGPHTIQLSADGYRTRVLRNVESPGSTGQVVMESVPMDSEQDSRTVVYRPVVDFERTNQADFIFDRQLQNLPVNRRNYLSLAALTPGVAAVNDYVGITDAPLVQAPESGLSFGGNNGRGNVYWLDGGEDYINTGGVRPSISQEAVAEFQVVRSNYSAEWGGGIGGIVNIVSKAGTNAFHGDIFGFVRDRSFQARNYFSPEKGAYTRSQTGGTLGGPVRRNRTYFYLSFERLARNETAYISLGGNQSSFSHLQPSQQALVSYLATSQVQPLNTLAQITGQLLTTSNYPGTVALFKANSGFFPFHELDNQGAVRMDHSFSDNHHAFLRFNASRGDSANADVEGLTAFSRATVSGISDATLMLNDTMVLSERLVSESRLQLIRTRYSAANQDQVGPSIDIDGYGLFGKDWTLPSTATEWHGQFQQNFFFTPNRHSIRFGIDINPVHAGAKVEANIGGRFSFGEYLPLGQLYNTFSGPTAASQLAGLLQAAGQPALVPALNDPLSALQVYNLGLPSVYIQGFGNPVWSGMFQRYNFFFNDVFRANPRLTLNIGVRYELEAPPSPLQINPTNVGPRLGLAWDVTGDRKTVLRAGYGLFYLRQQTQIAATLSIQNGKTYNEIEVPLSGLPGSNNPATGKAVTSADIFQGLSRQGIIGTRAIQASDLAQFGIVPGPNFPYQIIFQRPQNFVNAYSQQTSFELERAFGDFSVLAGYNFNRGIHLPRLVDLNQTYGPPGPLGLATIVPLNPLVSELLTFQSAADSFYHALFLQISRRFNRTLTLDAHYTFSKSIDESTDINFLPNNSLNPRADRGLSTFDQRHRLVISAVQQLPGGSGSVLSRWFGGWTLSPIVTANSGRPFNVVTGIDFNSLRPAGAGRNIGQGPSFASVDMRISRTTHLAGRAQLEWIAEGFNLLNHTNFRRLNNTVGDVTVNQLQKPLLGIKGDPAQPLSFLSAFDPRQLQFALKFRF